MWHNLPERILKRSWFRMDWQQKMTGLLAVVLVGMAGAAGAQSESAHVSGVLENYVMAYPQPQQMQTQAYLTYLHVQGTLQHGLGFTAGTLFYRGHNTL